VTWQRMTKFEEGEVAGKRVVPNLEGSCVAIRSCVVVGGACCEIAVKNFLASNGLRMSGGCDVVIGDDEAATGIETEAGAHDGFGGGSKELEIGDGDNDLTKIRRSGSGLWKDRRKSLRGKLPGAAGRQAEEQDREWDEQAARGHVAVPRRKAGHTARFCRWRAKKRVEAKGVCRR